MNLRLKRTPGIYLVGFMGSGKSTIGKLLADELGWNFVDLDEKIEQAFGTTIGALFDSRGEEEFRKIEQRELSRVVTLVERGKPTVVSLGGGAFAQPRNYELLENNGISIWLDCPVDILERRVGRQSHRPLARDIEKFRNLYHTRREFYAKADYRVEVSDEDAPVHVASILKLPLFE